MRKKLSALKNTLFGNMVRRFFDNNVAKNGAAHAYYLLFALFPSMIFISNLLATLDLDIHLITQWLSRLIPTDAVQLFESYLEYISSNYIISVLGFSLVFMLWFPFRATGSMLENIRTAYGMKNTLHPISFLIRQVIFTVVLFVAIAISLLASTFGKRVILFILKYINISLPIYAITLWHYLRFLLIGVFMFVVIAFLYAIAHDKRPPALHILPGALMTILAWTAVSAGFSFYVENFAKYSVIYGALGTVIVLMLWLYMISVILILGAEFNRALIERRAEKQAKKNTDAD